MDYRYLEAFLSVAENLNFTRAAEDLYITPAAISRQIKNLEENLGMQLLIRSPQKVILTNAGRELYSHCMRTHKWIHETFEQEGMSTIRIAALQGVMENWLITFLSKYYKRDKTTFKISQMDPGLGKELLISGEVDIVLGNTNWNQDNLSSFRLFHEDIVLIGPPKATLQAIGNYNWVVCSENDYIVNYARKAKIHHPERIIYVESMNSIVRFVEKGMGVAMVPFHVIPKSSRLNQTSVMTLSREYIYASTLNYEIIPKALEQFLANLREAAQR